MSEGEVRASMVAGLTDALFGGDAKALVSHLHRAALRRAGRERAADLLWKLALVGGLASATAQTALDLESAAGRVAVPGRPTPVLVTYDVRDVATVPAGPGLAAHRPAFPPLPAPPADRRPWLAAAFAAWLAVAAFRVAARVRAHRCALRALGPRRPVDDATVLDEVAALARRAGLRRAPGVSVGERIAARARAAEGLGAPNGWRVAGVIAAPGGADVVVRFDHERGGYYERYGWRGGGVALFLRDAAAPSRALLPTGADTFAWYDLARGALVTARFAGGRLRLETAGGTVEAVRAGAGR